MSESIQKKASLIEAMARAYNLEPGKFFSTIQATIMPRNASTEETIALLSVANQYGLNPFTKEIYAFPKRGGGIVPMVPIDGWLKLINSHPQFDGMEFSFTDDKDGKLVSCTCTLYRKDRTRPFVVTEFYEECVMDTDPWKKKPRRMLMHKTAIQAGRYAFSFAGIIDEDEAAQYDEMGVIEATATPAAPQHAITSGVEALKTKLNVEARIDDTPEYYRGPSKQEIEKAIAETRVPLAEEPQQSSEITDDNIPGLQEEAPPLEMESPQKADAMRIALLADIENHRKRLEWTPKQVVTFAQSKGILGAEEKKYTDLNNAKLAILKDDMRAF